MRGKDFYFLDSPAWGILHGFLMERPRG